MALKSKLEGGELYDLASEKIKPLLEQVNQVGLVEIVGGRKREIQVQVNRDRMKARELSVTQIAGALKNSGQNVPAGKIDQADSEMVFRTLGEFNSLDQIKNSIVSFFGNDAVTKVSDIGTVTDTLETERLRVYLNGEKSLFLNVYKQSGTNTVAVAKDIYKKLEKINEELARTNGKDTQVVIIRDTTKFIWANVVDVGESIAFGIILTILVVYLFLGSTRSTVITGFAIPVSLIGSFALFAAVGLTINIMSLLAFSLAVGLLIDDAIVVRENIFRHLEMGKSATQAALDGTAEVGVAVFAVTLLDNFLNRLVLASAS
jgi:HAE1 family hydrophobic/amphiphilic exporter-1